MFLGHLYRLLDQVQSLEKGAAGTVVVETFVNSSFLQVFLWERFKGIEVSPLSYPKAKSLVGSDEGSYVPESLPLICRWSWQMQREGQKFIELLDDIEKFIFRPYCALSEGFRCIPFYADSDVLLEALAKSAQGEDHLEVSVHYAPYRVRRQLGFDQGMPSSPSDGDSLTLHRIFWTRESVSGDGKPLAFALANRGLVGGLSKAYQVIGIAALLRLADSTLPIVVDTPQNKGKGKEAPVIPKRQSMHILQTRFANTRKNKGEVSGPKVVVTVDDDENDEGDAVETEIGVCEQESGALDEDLDEDQYYNRNEGTFMGPDTHSE
ncbi:hypothetical protein L3X38_033155 [Prunus dulcis]|uniref:Aminotransferase-like plant mobile domain-containing protein n=1 Tax=Prunus dulcis TaxID=3755 RepID=A0AAD4YVM3_PRUDU|nr:hypothetical protein L3X38_033155 [Prunus dulcis]